MVARNTALVLVLLLTGIIVIALGVLLNSFQERYEGANFLKNLYP